MFQRLGGRSILLLHHLDSSCPPLLQPVPTLATRSLLPDSVSSASFRPRPVSLRFHTHVCAHGFSSGLLPPPFFFPRPFFLAAPKRRRRRRRRLQRRPPRSSSPPTYLPVSLHAYRPRGYAYTRVYARYACTSLETLIFREIISPRKAASARTDCCRGELPIVATIGRNERTGSQRNGIQARDPHVSVPTTLARGIASNDT